MHPKFSQSSLLFSLILFLLSHHFPCSLCLDDFHHSNCTSLFEFECRHDLGKIEYPFWVYGHQPEYCGHPLFKLYCEVEHAIIEIKSRKYKVLSINPKSQILRIVTMEVLPREHIVCPQSPLMDSTPFNYTTHVEMVAFTLTYDCSSIGDHPGAYDFSCTMNDSLHQAYLARNLSVATELQSRCEYSAIIHEFPVLVLELEGLVNGSSDDVEEVLREGFEVQWTADNAICKECVGSGGTCGYNTTSNKSCCLCRDKPYPNKCSSMYPSSPLLLFSSSIPIVFISSLCSLCWFFC
ncbi:hypothetical protein PVL29_022108 [Vitis rotundifolia]|uniref:non-specific serine/threonine protein kinase n=1 Tax=Vitis rotundifolia TaxID=103349 RepID=A0AA38YUP0_VITRO|nr:hypothetical protein PVL29_022108 [Vitis rotundifolia]